MDNLFTWFIVVFVLLPIFVKLFLTYVVFRWLEERHYRRMEQIFRDAQYDREYQDYEERVHNFYKDNTDKTE